MEHAKGIDIARSLCEVALETYKSDSYSNEEKEKLLMSLAVEWSKKASEQSHPKAGHLLLLGVRVTSHLLTILNHQSPWLNVEGFTGMRAKKLYIHLENLHLSSVCYIASPTLTKLMLSGCLCSIK